MASTVCCCVVSGLMSKSLDCIIVVEFCLVFDRVVLVFYVIILINEVWGGKNVTRSYEQVYKID